MRIHTNIAALNTHNRLKFNQTCLNKTLEKLSPGYRINRAADDAAGLTISENMRAQIRGLKRANLNAQDGLSYVNTADGVIQEGLQVLQRMRELTVQSLNDTLTKEDRLTIQKELSALKHSINSMSEDSRYNGSLKAVEDYAVPHVELQGIRQFDGPIIIAPGINDEIIFNTNVGSTAFTIPAGKYDSIEELADTVDSILMSINPNMVISITEDRRLTVQVDHSNEIVNIKGTGSSLFMDYKIGNKPGMIIGTTDFSTGDGKLYITAGQNDYMSFYIGSTQQISLTLPAGSYTRDEIIDQLNQRLAGTGAEALAYGDKNISVVSETLPVTGLSGNMFKVDIHTSVFYDNIHYGQVSKSRSSFYGATPLNFPLKFNQGESFTINAVNRNHQPIKLKIELAETADKTFNTEAEFVSYLKDKIDAANIDVTVSVQSNRLHFQSNFWGANHNVSLDSSSSDNVRMTLFDTITEVLREPTSIRGRDVAASISGYYHNRQTMDINDSNNKLTILVNNNPLSITIPPQAYTPQQLVDYMNQQFVANNVDVSMSFSMYNNKYAFSLISDTSTIQLDGSSALQFLFGGQSVTSATVVQGKDGAPVHPTEGTVGAPEIEKFPAVATGKMPIGNSVTITDELKNISFTLGGVSHSIDLTPGTYSSEAFLTHVNTKLTGIDVSATIENNRLILTTHSKGQGVYLTNVSGFGMDLIQVQEALTQESTTSKIKTSITASPSLTGKVIDATNKEMTFHFMKDGNFTNVMIELDQKEYTSAELVAALNEKLRQQNVHNEWVFKSTSGYLQLEAVTSGATVQLNTISGSLYDELFRKHTYLTKPYQSNGYTSRQIEAYAVGRQDLDTITEIFPSTNDLLTFDVKHKGTKYTLNVTIPPGSYTGQQLTSVFNQSLKQELQRVGLPEDFLESRIGAPNSNQNVSNANKFVLVAPSKNDGRNDNGETIIDAIRGSAAYSIFYQSNGLPEPSYVTGMVDLSKGLTIIADVNDQLSVDVNNQTYHLTFPAGEYDADILLQVLNDELSASNTGLIASYANNYLRLSYKENGMVPIDGFTGNARGSLIFPTASRGPLEEMKLHIGANENQSMTIQKVAFSDRALRINTIYVGTRESGEKALTRLDKAISNMTDKLSTLGAVQNRLEHVLGINSSTSENLSAAESKIRDADMAKEMMHLLKQNILSQAATTMLAQASKAPEAVLNMLK